MRESFCEQLDVFTHHATESEVRVELCDMSQGQIRALHGGLRGPRCSKAKTLQAGFAVGRLECQPEVARSTSFLVTEPCYWTPELPMLYNLTLDLELAGGSTMNWRQALGLRRWEIHGDDFFRDGKRVVLRGAVIEDCSPDILAQADESELTLVVRDPSDEGLQRASELGVPLVVDMRGIKGEPTPRLLRYAWYPAVALVLLGDGATEGFYQPPAVKIGRIGEVVKPRAVETDWADAFVFELNSGERPPAWAAICGRPVIAIRRGGTYSELAAARRGCDRLQAELAPDFDLAGYFV